MSEIEQVDIAYTQVLDQYDATADTSVWHIFPNKVKRDIVFAQWVRNVIAYGEPTKESIKSAWSCVIEMYED